MKIDIKITVDNIETLFEVLKLKEHHLYKVLVKMRANNPTHIAFLFTGFKNGNNCYIYTNSHDDPTRLQEIYSIKIIKALTHIGDRRYGKD